MRVIELFNKNFMKLAIGFIAIIAVSMTVISATHAGDSEKVADTTSAETVSE